jgi:lysophospholipase L1-like esterase
MPRKTALAIALFAAVIFGLQYAPVKKIKLERYNLGRVLEFRPRNVPVAAQPRIVPVRMPHPANISPHALNIGGLVDPYDNLTTFYQALWRTESKAPGAITRVLHYGDSPTTADSITADARALLQQQFGDAGHGFVLIAKPWAWYGHRGVELTGHGWRIEPASQSRARDGVHGLGGVSFTGGTSASSTIQLPDDQHSRMQVYFEQQPGGGVFTLSAGDVVMGEVPTDAQAPTPGFAWFALPPHTRRVTLAVKSGTVRLFGWSFEKPGPGIIYNSLGLNGAAVQMLLRYFEPQQWAVALQHEDPDLIVLNYGTNESVFPDYIERYYEKELRSLIERVRAMAPRASVLIMSPMDRGVRSTGGEIVTPEVLPRIVEIQAKVAMETRCAFFNTFEAMGGAGTMGKWYAAQPRLVSADFMHPLPGGAAIVGRLLKSALCDGYERFKRGRLQARRGPDL